MVWWSAIVIGFAGSLHCVGMCGPLALAVTTASGGRRGLSSLLYQLGRITTYSLFGLILGGIGFTVTWAGIQQPLSIALGSIILLAVLVPKLIPAPRLGRYQRAVGILKASLGRQLSQRSYLANYMVGLLNGLLPCGLVYLALAGALATYSPVQGALYMASFGLGTLPLMLSLTWFGQWLTPALRSRFRSAVPYIVGVMGLVLILRGLDLGIPYLSPMLPEHVTADMTECN